MFRREWRQQLLVLALIIVAVGATGSIESYDLRAQNPHGPFGQPMLSLRRGPAGGWLSAQVRT